VFGDVVFFTELSIANQHELSCTVALATRQKCKHTPKTVYIKTGEAYIYYAPIASFLRFRRFFYVHSTITLVQDGEHPAERMYWCRKKRNKVLAATIAYLVKHRLFINLERVEAEICISQDGGQIENQKNIHPHSTSL
jgi:hypothetical protein